MALTPEEQAELDRLEAEEAARKAKDDGSRAVARVQAQRRPIDPSSPRPFSLYRATVGALRDAAQGVADTIDDAGDYLQTHIPLPSVVFGSAAANGVVGIRSAADTTKAVKSSRALGTLPTLKGEEQAGTAERIVRGVGSFVVPFAAASKAVGVTRGAGWLGRAGRAALAGGIVDFAQVDPVSGNMANFVRDTFGINSKTLDALAGEEDDDALYNRFKAAAVNAPVGIATDAVFEVGFKALKAYRAWKGTAEEAAETVKEIKRSRGIDPYKDPAKAPEGAAAGPDGAAKAAPEDAEFWHIPPEYDPSIHAEARPQPQSFEDVLDYLKRQSGTEVNEEALSRLGDNLLWGNPENALAKLGIDPAKLDFSVYDDPDLLGRLHKGLAEVYETIASKLGRSNIRVTEAATVQAARAFASTADILKDVHGQTENLAETLTGARLFVGAHAHKLLSSADKAIDEILAGGAGPEWQNFLVDFHRHAYYLGTIRGAGSEVGRALRSLQIIGKAEKPQAAKALGDLLVAEKVDQRAALGGDRSAIERGASDYADRLQTDAEKLDALNKLKQLGGDVGELSREVRRQNGSSLKRVDSGLWETVGNLFSPSTATYNILAGGAMLGTRALSKGLAAVGRMALSPLGARHSVAARVALTDTWAYTHGVLSGFGEAYRNSIAILQREGFAELAHNANSLGFEKLALKQAEKSQRAEATILGQNYERADTKNFRSLGVSASEMNMLRRKIDAMDGPRFFTEGLKALARVGGSTLNAAGTLSRSGTLLFINLPDQFVGTLAARAGSYSQSVRIAASEAAELGLEGKELSSYLKARTVQLAGDTKGWHEDAFRAGQQDAIAAHGEAEAREVLFQDDLELGLDKAIARGLTNVPLLHMIVPFVKTPLRILERTAIDNTPLGLVKDRVRKAILAGGPEGDEALARMSLGTLAIFTAYQLADDRTIIGADGGYKSSARLSRGSYTLKIGDDNFEFSRIDPIGTLLGFGADIQAYFHSQEDDPEASDNIMQATEAMLWATSTNILSKTWLTSLRNLTDLVGATSDDEFSTRLRKFIGGTATRFVPASGIERQVEKASDGYIRDAQTFSEQLFKASLGSDTLPMKRDQLLGRPVPLEGWDRIVGLRQAPGAGDDDPLARELEKLSFDMPGARRTIQGVKLNATQFNRWLELRGQVTKKPETGLTMEDTLTKLIELPAYQSLSRTGRIDAMRKEMEGYSHLATQQLLREDKDFAYRALRREVFDRTLLQGGTRDAADVETRRFAQQLGLTPPQ